MKLRLLFFSIMLVVFSISSMQAKEFEKVLLNLDCSNFEVTASTDMSLAPNPYNWLSATGMEWTSANVYAQNESAGVLSFIGKAIRFGSTVEVGNAKTPKLDLSPKAGEKVVLRISVTAGSDKTGSMQINFDGKTLGTIVAATDNGGVAFSKSYYIYDYELTEGTEESQIEFIHSRVAVGGNLYINSIKVYREPITLVKLDCSAFTANSSSEMSVGKAPHNWTTAIGMNLNSQFCYAQKVTTVGSEFLDKCIRLGATTSVTPENPKTGDFKLENLNLKATGNVVTKLYFEVAAGATKVGQLNVTVDGTPLVAIDVNKDGDTAVENYGETCFGSKWYAYDLEIKEGTDNSEIQFTSGKIGMNGELLPVSLIYIRNLRVYQDGMTGVSVSETRDISVYPTCFQDRIITDASHIRIFSVSGVMLMDQNIVDGQVDTSALVKGCYILVTTDATGKISSHKVVKY